MDSALTVDRECPESLYASYAASAAGGLCLISQDWYPLIGQARDFLGNEGGWEVDFSRYMLTESK
jgi:hypothetical protein